ncbi:MAG: VCBS repeat-containing protein [Gemmatimonadota bacterium]
MTLRSQSGAALLSVLLFSPPIAAAQRGVAAFPSYTRSIAGFPVFDSAGRSVPYPFLGGLDHPRPQLVDIDGDGDLDLFVQEYTGRMMFFENTGTRTAPRFEWRSDQFQQLDVGEWSRFVDLDGDGDLDLMAESPYSFLRAFRNAGSKTAPRFEIAMDTLRDAGGQPIFSDRQNIPQVVDLDCDGKLDLLLGRASGMVTHYREERRQDGLPVFRFVTDSFQHIQIIGQQFNGPSPNTPPGSMHGANTMIVTDLDQDGDADLLWGDYFEPGLLWLVNSGSCGRPVIGRDSVHFPANAPLATSGYNAPAVADLDGDGDLDLMVGVLGGAYNPDRTSRENLYYLEQTGRLEFTLRTQAYLPSIDVGSESSPALVDLDGDGDLDLVLGSKIRPDNGKSGGLYWWENRGSARAPEWHEAGALPIGGDFHYAPAFGDLDGDGDPDLLLGTWRDGLPYYRNDGTRQVPHWVLADSALVRLTRGSYATPALVDIDGDGDLDLFVGESSGEINFYRNDGTARQPRFTLVSDVFNGIEAGRRSSPAFSDLDGDGDQDLVIGTESGALVLYRNSGTRQVPRFVLDASFSLPLPPLSAPAFADVDGDGRPELFAGTASGGVVVFRVSQP